VLLSILCTPHYFTMSSSIFKVEEHILECQHIREYARATALSQEDVLHLAIKQYIPFDNLEPKEGDITIIGAHANGFPKVSVVCISKLMPSDILIRNYMNHYGMTCMLSRNLMVLKSEVSGLQM
jgi:hypothetical protein